MIKQHSFKGNIQQKEKELIGFIGNLDKRDFKNKSIKLYINKRFISERKIIIEDNDNLSSIKDNLIYSLNDYTIILKFIGNYLDSIKIVFKEGLKWKTIKKNIC